MIAFGVGVLFGVLFGVLLASSIHAATVYKQRRDSYAQAMRAMEDDWNEYRYD